MTKAIITNRIFVETDIELEKELLKGLTYSIEAYRPELPPRIITNARVIKEGLMSIPSGRLDLIPDYYDIIDRRVTVPVEFPPFAFKLRESQQAVYDQINSDAFINAWTSWGKTFTALAIAGKLGQKTLVIVHTVALRDQWVKETEKVYGFTPSIIGSGKLDTSMPITIGNVQSLTKLPRQTLEKAFGTIMVDECHHIPSKTFSALIDTSHAKYKIGLSASTKRKDKLHVLFSDYFSKKTFTPPRENYIQPTIHRVSVPIRLADGTQSWAEKVNDLCHSEDYQKYVALIAASYAAKGHKVLVVSARTGLLERCHELTPNSVCVIGSTKLRDEAIQQIKDNTASILYGSINIFSEGISVNELSCLVLATPLNNEPLLEQLIGRVIRKLEGKIEPVIVDIQLIGKTVANQAQLRKAYYLKQGYNITDI
jgi:superfamily II DNA or RNA helicase